LPTRGGVDEKVGAAAGAGDAFGRRAVAAVAVVERERHAPRAVGRHGQQVCHAAHAQARLGGQREVAVELARRDGVVRVGTRALTALVAHRVVHQNRNGAVHVGGHFTPVCEGCRAAHSLAVKKSFRAAAKTEAVLRPSFLRLASAACLAPSRSEPDNACSSTIRIVAIWCGFCRYVSISAERRHPCPVSNSGTIEPEHRHKGGTPVAQTRPQRWAGSARVGSLPFCGEGSG
jgi:hypothetical protein